MAESKQTYRLWIGIVFMVISLFASGCSSGATSTVIQSAVTPSPEVSSGQMLKDLRATENAILTTYGWIDRKGGVVRIPIDRAMELLLQRGLPTRPVSEQNIQEF